MIITDRKTGKKYNPDKELKKLFNKKWFIEILKRLKFR